MSISQLEPPKKKKRPYGLVTPNGIPTSTPGRSGTDHIVAAGPLADLLEPEIAKLHQQTSILNQRNQEMSGGVEMLAARAADYLIDTTPEAVIRRLYDIRFGKSRTVNTELADALLLAVNRHIENEPIAQLPGGKEAALEMAQIHYEDSDEPYTQLDVKRLAKQLVSFSAGYVADCKDETVELEEWARRVASYRIRKARERGLLPALEDDAA